MSEFAGNSPRKFISFRHFGVKSNAHKLPEERESENPQNVAESKEANTVDVGETKLSPAKVKSVFPNVPVSSKVGMSEEVEKDHELAVAERDCVLTSSDDDVDNLSAFVAERLQCLSEGSVEKLIGEECMNVDENLCGGVGIGEEDGGDKRRSVCPGVTNGGDVDVGDRRFSPDAEINRILREELGSVTVTSTPKRAAWPIYNKGRSSVLNEPDEPVCKAVVFDVASGSGAVGGAGLSKGNDTNTSEGVPESFVTSGRFSALEGIAQRQADERVAGVRVGSEGEGMVLISPVDEMLEQEFAAKEKTRYYPSQSAKSLLKECFEMNPPTRLDPSHPTTSFTADQLIQFAPAVGLEVSLASYSMLEDLLLKTRGGSEAHPMTSRYTVGRSPFPSVVGSSMGDGVASRPVYSLPTITETEGTNVIVGEDVVQEPCSSRQADARLALGTESVQRPGTDSLETLQQIKSSQKKKKKSHSYKWSREGRLNPLLPSGDDKGGYVFTEEMFELAPFAKVFATGPEDPLENKYCFYCILCRRNISMRTRGLYELKRHFQRDCHFRADQRFREKPCPGKVRGSDGRVLYGSRFEAKREFYMELDVPYLDFKRPFYYDVLEGKPFTFTSEESRVRIQFNLLMTFLKSGGQLWALEDYWTQVGIATGHSAAIADFNWIPAHISVSNFGFSSKFQYKCGVFILRAIYGQYDRFLSVILFCLGMR